MRKIDLENWPRRKHFELYMGFEHPRFEISAHLDITSYYKLARQHKISFTVGLVYLVSRAANQIPEFRQRIRGKGVVQHHLVHPSFTILVDDDIFSFCYVDYHSEFTVFEQRASLAIQQVKEQVELEDEPGRDDYLFLTSIPWVSFTSLSHPMPTHPGDCIPRISWGKFYQESEILKMPLSVDAHHALVDGLHVGRFFIEMERCLETPQGFLGIGQP